MPLLSIETNQHPDVLEDEADQLIMEASRLTADMLGKPEQYVMVAIRPNQNMSFGGNRKPLAYVELKSLGLPEERTTEFSQRLCGLIQQRLRLPPDRIYIEFTNGIRHLWGWNNATF